MLKKVLTVVIAFVTLFTITTVLIYNFRYTTVTGPSMNPTLTEGERVMFLYTTNVDRGDIAIIRDDSRGYYLIKRVIGIGGDTVEVKDSVLYVNGEYVPETYLKDKDWSVDDFTVDVPEGKIFVMGDNRGDSYDSRLAGPFDVTDVYGKYLLTISK